MNTTPVIKPEQTQFEKELIELGFVRQEPDYYKDNIYLWGLIKQNKEIGYFLKLQRRDKINPYRLIEINDINKLKLLIEIL